MGWYKEYLQDKWEIKQELARAHKQFKRHLLCRINIPFMHHWENIAVNSRHSSFYHSILFFNLIIV